MSLNDVWKGASASPFAPAIGKNSQLPLGFTLLVIALLLAGRFGFGERSLSSLILIGVPASLAFGFGAVYMICGVGVYV